MRITTPLLGAFFSLTVFACSAAESSIASSSPQTHDAGHAIGSGNGDTTGNGNSGGNGSGDVGGGSTSTGDNGGSSGTTGDVDASSEADASGAREDGGAHDGGVGDGSAHDGGAHEGGAGDGGLGLFGAACTKDADCQSNACFIGGMASYCSIHCTTNADCPNPPTSGVCNVQKFCKK